MIIAAKTSDEIREVKETLKNASKMKESGVGKFIFLGMEIDHDKNAGTLMIKQTRYIRTQRLLRAHALPTSSYQSCCHQLRRRNVLK